MSNQPEGRYPLAEIATSQPEHTLDKAPAKDHQGFVVEFQAELEKILNSTQKPEGWKDVVILQVGEKYTRVVCVRSIKGELETIKGKPAGSACAFIENSTGDLYKPAGYKGPAKNVIRGNIRNGTWRKWCGPYGIHSAK